MFNNSPLEEKNKVLFGMCPLLIPLALINLCNKFPFLGMVNAPIPLYLSVFVIAIKTVTI